MDVKSLGYFELADLNRLPATAPRAYLEEAACLCLMRSWTLILQRRGSADLANTD
jgi:hypothetical protein